MIYCFYGFSKAGKDTIAKELIQKMNFERISFADKPKQILCKILNKNFEKFEEIKDTKFEDKTYRECLIDLAEEIKKIDKNFWVKFLINNLKDISNKNYVLTDLRFYHELNYLRENLKENVKFIKIIGGERINEDLIQDKEFDLILDNSEKKEENIEKFVKKIKELN